MLSKLDIGFQFENAVKTRKEASYYSTLHGVRIRNDFCQSSIESRRIAEVVSE